MKKIIILMFAAIFMFCVPIYASTSLTFTNIGSEYSKPTSFIVDRSDFENSKLYVSCEKGNLLSSNDQGMNWDSKNLAEQDLIQLARHENYWVTAINKNSNSTIMFSTEGRSWSFYDFATPIKNILNDKQSFYLITEDNRLYSSPTGIIGTWVYEVQNSKFANLTRIEYSPEASKYFILMDNKPYITTSLLNVPTPVTFSETILNNHTFYDFIIKENTIYLLSPTEGIITATLSLNNISYVKDSEEGKEHKIVKEPIYKAMFWQDNRPLALTKEGHIVDEKGSILYKTYKDFSAPIEQIEADGKYLYILLVNEGLVRYDFKEGVWKDCIKANTSMRTFDVQNDTTTLISNESPFMDNILFKVDSKLNQQVITKGYGYKAPIFKRGNKYVIRDTFNKEIVSKNLKVWNLDESKMIPKISVNVLGEESYYEFPNQIYFKEMIFSFQDENPNAVLTFIHDESLDKQVIVNKVSNSPITSTQLTIAKKHDHVIDIAKFNLDSGNLLSIIPFKDKLRVGTDKNKLLTLDVEHDETSTRVKVEDVYTFPHLKDVKKVKVLNGEILVMDQLTLYCSKDVTNWENTVIPNRYFKDAKITDIAYGEEFYVAIGTNGQMASSKDLKSWETISIPRATDLTSITYDGEKFIVCGEDGSLFVSNIIANFK